MIILKESSVTRFLSDATGKTRDAWLADAGLSIRARDGPGEYTKRKSLLSSVWNRRVGMQMLERHCVKTTRD